MEGKRPKLDEEVRQAIMTQYKKSEWGREKNIVQSKGNKKRSIEKLVG